MPFSRARLGKFQSGGWRASLFAAFIEPSHKFHLTTKITMFAKSCKKLAKKPQ